MVRHFLRNLSCELFDSLFLVLELTSAAQFQYQKLRSHVNVRERLREARAMDELEQRNRYGQNYND